MRPLCLLFHYCYLANSKRTVLCTWWVSNQVMVNSVLQSISIAFKHCVLRVVVAYHEFLVNIFTDCHGKGMSSPLFDPVMFRSYEN